MYYILYGSWQTLLFNFETTLIHVFKYSVPCGDKRIEMHYCMILTVVCVWLIKPR